MRRRLVALVAVAALLAVPTAAHATLAFDVNLSRPKVWVSPSGEPAAATEVGSGLVLQVSPNGEFVAYQRNNEMGETELLLYDVATGERRELLTGLQGGEATFAWSPDSTMVAALGGGGRNGSNDLRKRTLLVLGVDGGTRRIASGFFRGVSFSPDGRELVFGLATGQGSPPFQPEPPADLVRAPVTGGRTTTITHDHISSWPLWGPRGKIAFVRQVAAKRAEYGTKNDLFLIGGTGGRAKRLTHTKVVSDGTRIYPAAWSPSGLALLANYEGLETNYAAIVDPRAGGQTRIGPLPPDEPFTGVAFTADETAVLGHLGGVYSGAAYRTIASVPVAGGPATVLKRAAFSPSWGG